MFDIELVNSTYEDLSAKVKADLDEQFNKGRIKGTDYANVYSNLINTILQLSFEAPLREVQIESTNEDINVKKKQEGLYTAQTAVANRQEKSFDDSIRLKLFSTQMNTWGIMFSSGMLEDKPNIITNDQASSLYQDIRNRLQ